MAEADEEGVDYWVTHVRRILVTQVVTARSKAEAMRKARDGEDQYSEWLEWHTVSGPGAYRAYPVQENTQGA